MQINRIVTRPDFMKLPELPLPIYVRSSGVYKVELGWNCSNPSRTFAQIFWCVSGKGRLNIEDASFELSEGDVAFKLPQEAHSYLADSGPWEVRWATFDGPGAASFLASYAYPKLIRDAGPCPLHLFEEMETGLREMTPFRQRKLIAGIAEILALAGGSDEDKSKQGRIVRRFIELAQTNYPNASVNVNSIADIIGVHRTTLARVFMEKMLISPGEYLARLRMQHALALLREPGASIAEIGEKVGIPDPTYFCRCVRKATGLSPREYRNAGAGA